MYVITQDSDASSSDDDDDSDDNKTTKKKVLASIAINEKPSLFESSSCFMAKATKVNYKAGGRHWVLDSGCTQHMIGDARMFNSINTNGNDGYDSITFGDNGKARSRGLVRLQYPMT